MTSERDVHPDEGTIHAWLDRQLDDLAAATLEAHLQRCDECAERVAEARGLIAGTSRVLSALDAGTTSMSDKPVLSAVRPDVEPPRPLVLSGTVRGPRRFRLTPARSAIAAVLVVAVATAIIHEHERPSGGLAAIEKQSAERPDAAAGLGAASAVAAAPAAAAPSPASPPVAAPVPSAAAPLPGAPNVAPAPAPQVAQYDSTASTRVAAARTFARTQRETTVNADLARVAAAPAAAASTPTEQTIAAAKAADSAVGAANRVELRGSTSGVAGGVARIAAPARVLAGVEASQCYRVESATGAAATWGPVSLPFVLALDAPATSAAARVLTPAGQDAEARAVFERRGGDSLLFTLQRVGYTGTLAVGASGEVRAGVMRSAPAGLQLESVATNAPRATEQKRALRKPSAAQARADSASTASARAAAPAVPVVVRKVGCGG